MRRACLCRFGLKVIGVSGIEVRRDGVAQLLDVRGWDDYPRNRIPSS